MIENHVVNLELSKRLKELGLKQESLYKWTRKKSWPRGMPNPNFELEWHEEDTKDREVYSAFLASELGDILPDAIEHPDEDDQTIHLCIEHSVLWSVTYYWEHFKEFTDKSLCNAMAKMLIHLIEQGIVKV